MKLHRQIGTGIVALTIIAGAFTAIGPDARHQFGVMLGLAQAAEVEAELPGLVEAAEAKLGKSFSQMQEEFDRAVAEGVPLAQSGISDVEAAELAAQGSNLVVDCAATHREVNELNELLAQAEGSTLIACGGYSAAAPVVHVAPATKVAVADSSLSAAEKQAFLDDGFDRVGPCEGASGLLSDLLGSVGGDGWSCGYSSTDQK